MSRILSSFIVHRSSFLLLLSACQLVGMSVCALAQPQQSENFRITKSVLDAGGGASSSTNFQLVSAFGQPTPIGIASSTNFTLSAGFLTPTFAIAPTSPIQDVVIKRVPGLSNNMQLDWSAVPNATDYTIYRAATSNFVPAPGNQVGTSATNTFTDIGAVGLPATQYFYIVTYSFGNGPAALEVPGNGTITKQSSGSDHPKTSRETAKQ